MGASLVTVHAGQRARVGGTRRAWEPSSQSSRAGGQSRHVQTQGPPPLRARRTGAEGGALTGAPQRLPRCLSND